MDIIKSGNFICEQRKKLGLTQRKLAEIIGVTDKAVSKWENGRGFPDVSLLTPLAKVLKVSVAEILNGEIAEDNSLKAADKLILESYRQRKVLINTISAILLIIGIGIAISPLITAGLASAWIISVLIGMIVIAAAVLISTHRFIDFLPKLKLNRLYVPISFAAIIGAVVIEMLPYSYIMAFAAPPGEEPVYESYSYLAVLPIGYGIWFPMLTAVTSCIAAILVTVLLISTIICWCKNGSAVSKGKAAFICTSVSVFFSILTNLLFSAEITAYGILIMLLLILSDVCLFMQYKSK